MVAFSTLIYLRKPVSIYLFRYLLDSTLYYANLFLRTFFLINLKCIYQNGQGALLVLCFMVVLFDLYRIKIRLHYLCLYILSKYQIFRGHFLCQKGFFECFYVYICICNTVEGGSSIPVEKFMFTNYNLI